MPYLVIFTKITALCGVRLLKLEIASLTFHRGRWSQLSSAVATLLISTFLGSQPILFLYDINNFARSLRAFACNQLLHNRWQ